MSQAELLSIVGVLFGLLFGLVAVIFGVIRRDISKLEKWTVEKERFDREWRHSEYATKITAINAVLWPLKEKVDNLEGNQEDMREWKHAVIDPYIPRAVDEHERRINRLDAKVFNGGGK